MLYPPPQLSRLTRFALTRGFRLNFEIFAIEENNSRTIVTGAEIMDYACAIGRRLLGYTLDSIELNIRTGTPVQYSAGRTIDDLRSRIIIERAITLLAPCCCCCCCWRCCCCRCCCCSVSRCIIQHFINYSVCRRFSTITNYTLLLSV